jgi:hypothetical protein
VRVSAGTKDDASAYAQSRGCVVRAAENIAGPATYSPLCSGGLKGRWIVIVLGRLVKRAMVAKSDNPLIGADEVVGR